MTVVPVQAIRRERERSADSFAMAYRLQAPIWIFDIDNTSIPYANEAACALWQADSEAMIRARDFSDDMSSTVTKRLKQYQSDFIESGATFNEMWTLYPNGEPTSVMVYFSGFTLPDGRMAMQCEVIGHAEARPENLRSAEALLHTDVMITLFGKEGPPLYMNPAARNAFDPKPTSFSDIFVDPSDYYEMVADVEATGEKRLVAEVRTNGTRRWFDLSALACTDAATGAPAILLTAFDVTELKVARDRARRLADRDQLTGCFNRAYLQTYFDGLTSRQESGKLAIFFFDVDRFKYINDRNGHAFGDVVLTEISGRIRRMIRGEDLIARLGGDEFVVLLNNMEDEEEVARKAEEFRRIINLPIAHDATHIEATVSMGIVLISPQNADFATAMREADIALYTSKQAGRNRATFFSAEMGYAAEKRAKLEDDLREALEKEEFLLQYQPRIDLDSGKLISVEGLVRWQHPERGIVQPGDFIAVCEETGMIEDLGRLVLKMGCGQAIKWHKQGLKIGVSLNLSPRQFEDPGLYRLLSELAQRPGFPVGHIELEITENVLVGEHELIAKKLEEITALGYRIAIDDFGTGYSNLSYISQFPLDCIKIDRSFVSQLPALGPIVSLILTLGQQINTTVVAEGVETQEQMDWLKVHACRQVQGFLFSPPVDAESVAELVHKTP